MGLLFEFCSQFHHIQAMHWLCKNYFISIKITANLNDSVNSDRLQIFCRSGFLESVLYGTAAIAPHARSTFSTHLVLKHKIYLNKTNYVVFLIFLLSFGEFGCCCWWLQLPLLVGAVVVWLLLLSLLLQCRFFFYFTSSSYISVHRSSQ